MKKLKITNPRWLQEIIDKKEYSEITSRNIFFATFNGSKRAINPLKGNTKENFFAIHKKIGNLTFVFNSKNKEIMLK